MDTTLSIFVILGWVFIALYTGGTFTYQQKLHIGSSRPSPYLTSYSKYLQVAPLILLIFLSVLSYIGALAITAGLLDVSPEAYHLGTVLSSGISWSVCGYAAANHFCRCQPLGTSLRTSFMLAVVLNALTWNSSLVQWIDTSVQHERGAQSVFVFYSVTLALTFSLALIGIMVPARIVVQPRLSRDIYGGAPGEVGPPSPECEVSTYSWLLFSWVNPILERGLTQTVDFCDIFELLEADTCAVNKRIIRAAWLLETSVTPRRQLSLVNQITLSSSTTTSASPIGTGYLTANAILLIDSELLKEPLLEPPAPPLRHIRASPPGPASTSLMRTLLWHGYRGRMGSLALLRVLGILATYAQPVLMNVFIATVDDDGENVHNGDDFNSNGGAAASSVGGSNGSDGDIDDNGGEGGLDSTSSSTTKRWRYHHVRLIFTYALGLFALSLASACLDTHYGYSMQRLATQQRLGLMRFLLSKALRLSGKSRSRIGVGAIVSHFQMDCRVVSQGVVYVNKLWDIPLQLFIALYLLYTQLGVAAFAGLGVTLVLSPVMFALSRLARTYRRRVMKRRDQRVKFLTELLQGSKTIKLFALELKVRDEVAQIRLSEVEAIRATQLTSAVLQFLVISLPPLVCIATFAAFTIMGAGQLTPARTFTSLALLGLLSAPLSQIPTVLSSLIGMQVSADRINRFLHAEEFIETLFFSAGRCDDDNDSSHFDDNDDDDDSDDSHGKHNSAKRKGVGDVALSNITEDDDDDEDVDESDEVFALRWRQRLRQRKRYLRVVDSNSSSTSFDAWQHAIAKFGIRDREQAKEGGGSGGGTSPPTVALGVSLPSHFKNGHRVDDAAIVIHDADFSWHGNLPNSNAIGKGVVGSGKRKGGKGVGGGKGKGGKGIGGGKAKGGNGVGGGNKNDKNSSMATTEGRGLGGLAIRASLPASPPTALSSSSSSSSSSLPPVLMGVSVIIPRGALVAVVGRVGAGKSSFLAALLNELECSNDGDFSLRNAVEHDDRNNREEDPRPLLLTRRDNNEGADQHEQKHEHRRQGRAQHQGPCVRENRREGRGRSRSSGKVAVRGRVAYCSQEPWIRNGTLRSNILFGDQFHASHYASVIEACALTMDLQQLPDGDLTQIGERGLNLSGGQKARVALARAAYAGLLNESNSEDTNIVNVCDDTTNDNDNNAGDGVSNIKADKIGNNDCGDGDVEVDDADCVYLLDDVLSAVDRHTGDHLLKHVLLPPHGLLQKQRVRNNSSGGGSCERGKQSRKNTVVLVTNQMNWLDQADVVIVLGRDHPSSNNENSRLGGVVPADAPERLDGNRVLACGRLSDLLSQGFDHPEIMVKTDALLMGRQENERSEEGGAKIAKDNRIIEDKKETETLSSPTSAVLASLPSSPSTETPLMTTTTTTNPIATTPRTSLTSESTTTTLRQRREKDNSNGVIGLSHGALNYDASKAGGSSDRDGGGDGDTGDIGGDNDGSSRSEVQTTRRRLTAGRQVGEKRAQGQVDKRVWLGYARALGWHWVFAVAFIYMLSQALRTGGDFVLADWSSSTTSSDDDGDDAAAGGANSSAGGRLSWLYNLIGSIISSCFSSSLSPLSSQTGLFGLDGHLWLYTACVLLSSVFVLVRGVVLVAANVRACQRVHNHALWAVLRSPMDFFDTTTTGSVLNRFSSDQQLVDMQLRNQMASLFNSVIQLVAGLGVVLSTTPWVVSVLLLPPLAWVYHSLQKTYRSSAREVQRLMSVSRSPIIQEVTELVQGLATVRAFRKGGMLQHRVQLLIDRQARTIRCSSTLRRWLTLRLEACGALVVLAVAISAAIQEAQQTFGKSSGGANAALVGLSLSYATQVTSYLNGVLTSLSDAELGLVAMERLQEYADLLPEPPLTLPTLDINGSGDDDDDDDDDESESVDRVVAVSKAPPSKTPAVATVAAVDGRVGSLLEEGRRHHPNHGHSHRTPAHFCSPPPLGFDPSASWPQHGAVLFENVHMRYRKGLPNVLRGLSFEAKPGQHIGIVGRTGSGKSSLLVALFRLPRDGLSRGRIVVDGVNIATVGLHTLRSRVSIIPQDPVLFSGSLRSNLDPFNEFSDEDLVSALESVGLRRSLEGRMGAQSTGKGLRAEPTKMTMAFVEVEKSANASAKKSDKVEGKGAAKPQKQPKPQKQKQQQQQQQQQQPHTSINIGVGANADASNDASGVAPDEVDIGDSAASAASLSFRVLSMKIEPYGENLSVGQRQLVCIARGILKRRRVAVLDEATASIDKATDELIQHALTVALKKSTVLTIAHRLNTVTASDKVLVIDAGRAAEFGTPRQLLQDPLSRFYALWHGSQVATETTTRTNAAAE